MFELLEIENPTSPPILTDRERHDIEIAIKYRESRIEAEVENRTLDEDCFFDALLDCLEENLTTRQYIMAWLRRGGDASIAKGNINLDVMDMIRFHVEKDEKRGLL